jgi:uncharacterized coiled-coil DUF342 family protein
VRDRTDHDAAWAYCGWVVRARSVQSIEFRATRSFNFKELVMTTRAEYIEKMKHQLDELNTNMNKLDAKAQEVKEDARAKYIEEVGKLRNQSKLAGAKLDELKASTEDSWAAMVAEMDKVRDAFKHSFSYFKSQL